MRPSAAILTCLAALASFAYSAVLPGAAPLPTYHLHGYYKLDIQGGTWQRSDDSPWQVVAGESWIDPLVVKWGYVPLTHDGAPYYCEIDDRPRTGSNIHEQTFVCGDPETVKVIYHNNWKPKLLLYGGTR